MQRLINNQTRKALSLLAVTLSALFLLQSCNTGGFDLFQNQSTDSSVTPEDPTPPAAVKNYLLQDSSYVVPATIVSIHAHRYPFNNEDASGVSPAPTFSYGGVRSHDHAKLIWAEVNPQQGVYDWTALDAWVDFYYTNNIKIIYTVYGTPDWAASVNGGSRYPSFPTANAAPSDWTDLENFVKAVLNRYNTGGVQKIWLLETNNEPDLGWHRYGADGQPSLDFWIGSRLGNDPDDKAQRRADLAKWHMTIYDAAKSVDPDIKVLGPGFVWWGSTVHQGLIDFYNEEVNGIAVKDKTDGFAFHTYQNTDIDRAMIKNSLLAKEAVTLIGKPDMPIYLTEIGYLDYNVVTTFDNNNMATMAQRWIATAAGLGFGFVGLYSHDGGFLSTSQSTEISDGLDTIYNQMVGKTIKTAAELVDDRIWILFSDGTTQIY